VRRTDARVNGTRAHHDVDVLVKFTSAGIPFTWVVECKAWKNPIPKERVLVLERVVVDVGADRADVIEEVRFMLAHLTDRAPAPHRRPKRHLAPDRDDSDGHVGLGSGPGRTRRPGLHGRLRRPEHPADAAHLNGTLCSS
jgi:hypothetical protein